jgi:hypothetical protein
MALPSDVLPDVDLSALDFDPEIECAIPACAEPVAYRWHNRPCGCVALICVEHARQLIEWVRERAGQKATGGCRLCGQPFINVPFVLLFAITPLGA